MILLKIEDIRSSMHFKETLQELLYHDPDSLSSVVLRLVCVMREGTMVFCCHGWERGLLILAIRLLLGRELTSLELERASA